VPDAPEIKVKLTAEDAGVAAAIKELGVQLKNLKTQEEATASSSLNLSTALKGIAFGAVAYSVASFAKSVFDAGAQIARTSQITGASAQTIGVFHKAAANLGVDAEVVDLSFVRLSRSILNFQNGNIQTVAAFKQLGISAKDFVGLNTDQKIKLVTDRLGGMAEGTNRAALAQVLLGRGGAAALPVLKSLAGDGFAKIRDEAEAMGLLFDNQTANSILQMKKGIEDLKGEATGAATQFEVGLIPAITNVSNTMLRAINGGGAGGGFKSLGEEIGSLVEKVAYGLTTTGQRVAEAITIMETAWDYAISHMKESAIVLGEALTGNIGGAIARMKALGLTNAGADFAAQIAAIEKQFKTENDKANLDIFGGASNGPATKAATGKEGPGGSPPVKAAPDAAQKAAAAQFAKYLEDELSLQRASAKQSEEIEKEKYDQGEISLAEYFSRRKAAVTAEASEESAVIQREITAQVHAAEKAAVDSKHAATPKEKDKSEAEKITAQVHAAEKAAVDSKHAATTKEKDKSEAEKITALTKVMDLQTKLQESEIAASTKVKALDDEEFKAREENQQKVLEFQKQLAQLQGKTQEVTREDIALETQKLRIALEQAGQSKAQVDAELAQFTQLKTAQADFDAAKKKTEQDEKAFELEKQNIQIKAKAGGLSPLETEREINQLIRDRLPLLQADAAAELGAAQKTGNQENIASGQNAVQGVQNITVATNSLQKQLRGSLSQDFTNFFDTVGRGTRTVAQSFESLAASMIQSLQKVLEQKLMDKILGKDSSNSDGSGDGGGSGGGGGGILGGLLGLFGGHAGGGLIKGPGSPTSDSIPARLSPGEFVMKASAVNMFGAHNLEAINRGMQMPSIPDFSRLSPKFAEGGLVGPDSGSGSSSSINLGIGLDEGLILHHLSSKNAGRIIMDHVVNNPKAVNKAIGRSR
jgi:hypothetical protein